MEIIVQEKNIRIDKFLAEETEYSRALIQKMIDDNFILVNGKPTLNKYNVSPGDVIYLDESFKQETDIIGENIDLDIVYEDEDLMVINKPSGMVVHPGNGNFNGTLVNALIYYTKNLSDFNGEERPGIVHRIDKDTSGLMLVAKNNKTHELLSLDFKNKNIHREYTALLIGELKVETATIDAPIGRDAYDRKKMAVTEKNSKSAITHLRVLKMYNGYTLVNCKLETGRTHQIRVHANYIEHPVYNDPVYGKGKATGFGQFLHSSKLEFIHPIKKKRLNFECALPKEFTEVLDTFKPL